RRCGRAAGRDPGGVARPALPGRKRGPAHGAVGDRRCGQPLRRVERPGAGGCADAGPGPAAGPDRRTAQPESQDGQHPQEPVVRQARDRRHRGAGPAHGAVRAGRGDLGPRLKKKTGRISGPFPCSRLARQLASRLPSSSAAGCPSTPACSAPSVAASAGAGAGAGEGAGASLASNRLPVRGSTAVSAPPLPRVSGAGSAASSSPAPSASGAASAAFPPPLPRASGAGGAAGASSATGSCACATSAGVAGSGSLAGAGAGTTSGTLSARVSSTTAAGAGASASEATVVPGSPSATPPVAPGAASGLAAAAAARLAADLRGRRLRLAGLG